MDLNTVLIYLSKECLRVPPSKKQKTYPIIQLQLRHIPIELHYLLARITLIHSRFLGAWYGLPYSQLARPSEDPLSFHRGLSLFLCLPQIHCSM